MEIKTKVNKWDPIKLTKLLHSRRNYKQGEDTLRMGKNNSKKTPSEWEKITANETTDKGLNFKIYK